MTPDDERHGTRRGYYAHRKHGQEACDPCKAAAAAAEQGYVLARIQNRPGRVPATGTQRRLRALQALGWTITEIANHIGAPRTRVEKWANDQKTYVYATTAARVAEIYDELHMRVPTGPWAQRTRNTAQARGHHPPLAWECIDTDPEPATGEEAGIDAVVVNRILAGTVVPSTRPEREEVARRWVADGRPLRSLASLTGWKVERYYKASEVAA
jgi:hypothetical protein